MLDSAGTVLQEGDFVRVSTKAIHDGRAFDVGEVVGEVNGKTDIYWGHSGSLCFASSYEDAQDITRITREGYDLGRAGFSAGWDAGYKRAEERAGIGVQRLKLVEAAVDSVSPEALDAAIALFMSDPEDDWDDDGGAGEGEEELVPASTKERVAA